MISISDIYSKLNYKLNILLLTLFQKSGSEFSLRMIFSTPSWDETNLPSGDPQVGYLGPQLGEFPHLGNLGDQTWTQILQFSLGSLILHEESYPLVILQKAVEHGHRNSEFSHEKW